MAWRYFFFRELIKMRRVSLHNVDTANNVADIGMKHLGKQRHLRPLNVIKALSAQGRDTEGEAGWHIFYIMSFASQQCLKK